MTNSKTFFFFLWKLLFIIFVGPTGSQMLAGKEIVKKTKDVCVNPLKIWFNLMYSATYFRSYGDQMKTQLLILYWIPISTPPSMDRNSAMTKVKYHFQIGSKQRDTRKLESCVYKSFINKKNNLLNYHISGLI